MVSPYLGTGTVPTPCGLSWAVFSPIDPGFLAHLKSLGVLDWIDVIGVPGFLLNWNHWSIHAWPEKLGEGRPVADFC